MVNKTCKNHNHTSITTVTLTVTVNRSMIFLSSERPILMLMLYAHRKVFSTTEELWTINSSCKLFENRQILARIQKLYFFRPNSFNELELALYMIVLLVVLKPQDPSLTVVPTTKKSSCSWSPPQCWPNSWHCHWSYIQDIQNRNKRGLLRNVKWGITICMYTHLL